MPHSIDLWKGQSLIEVSGGTVLVIPGEELLVHGPDTPWHMPIIREEINRGDDVYYAARSDGQRVCIAGPEIITVFVIDFALAVGIRIVLLRSRKREDWDPGGLSRLDLVPLTDARLLIIYESGILLLNQEWDLQWHRRSPWVHLGFYLDPIESAVAWMDSEWGKIGYQLGDGAVIDPAGLYAEKLKQQDAG